MLRTLKFIKCQSILVPLLVSQCDTNPVTYVMPKPSQRERFRILSFVHGSPVLVLKCILSSPDQVRMFMRV